MANSYLSHSQSAGNRTNWTLSAWVKRSALGTAQYIMANYSGSNYCYLQINPDNKMRFLDYSSGNNCNKITTRLFRDTSAWYHVVIAIDTTDSTAEDRFKLYINGVRETAFDTSANFSSSFNTNMNVSGHTSVFGVNQEGNASYWSGYMSHVALVDGATLAPTVFGETDSTSGIWKFKSPSGVTWGTNGVHLKFENSAALGTDSSGQSNTYTVNGSLRQSLDTPSNVHATWNSLLRRNSTASFAYGNTAQTTNSSHQADRTASGFTTLGMTKGKWYAEFKMNAAAHTLLGVSCDINSNQQGSTGNMYSFIYNNKGFAYYSQDGKAAYNNGSNQFVTYGNTYATGDIIGIALDLDNYKLYFSKNGVWQNSGDPTSGSTGTGSTEAAGTPALPTFTGDNEYFFCHADYDQSAQSQVFANFGSGYFGTTAIASAGSNGNGSLFEYDVPSGYYALNTKNINTYG